MRMNNITLISSPQLIFKTTECSISLQTMVVLKHYVVQSFFRVWPNYIIIIFKYNCTRVPWPKGINSVSVLTVTLVILN